MKAIEVHQLIHNYHGLRALDGISFSVEPAIVVTVYRTSKIAKYWRSEE